jgi:hypothetical protein
MCHRDVAMGIQCLSSLARTVSGIRLIVHDDGTLTADDIAMLRQALPVQAIISRRDADEIMAQALRSHPACRRARAENVLMLKLFDVALTRVDDIRYCDADIFFVRPAPKLFDAPDSLRAVFMQDTDQAYSVRPWHLLPGNGLRLPSYLNSGLFVFSRSAFDLDYLEWLFSRENLQRTFAYIACWAEQTCWAALAFRAGCGFWDPQRVAVVNGAWALEERTVAAHFVSSWRSRLAQVLDQVASQNLANNAPAAVSVIAASECNFVTLAKSQLLRRVRRAGMPL